MNKNKIFHTLLLTAAMLGWAGAHAHGVWVAQRTGEWALVLGENAVDDEYKPEAVKKAVAFGANGAPLAVKIRPQARNVVLEPGAGAAAVAVSFEDGYWSQDASGKWLAGPKNKVSSAKSGGYYQMYSHTILAPGYKPRAGALSNADFPLQIIPLDDPLALKKGAALRVQVFFKGKPLAGVKLASDYTNDTDLHSGKTDAQGRVTLKIRNAGLNVIKVSHTIARADKTEADEDGYAATLAFSFPHQD